ncbi:MAG: DUF3575 domain-containing protein [Tannerella sp.]|jgi:long-subunit fatty acid transport protein|nr:DUF3575 domain-containing protein [Tannerella sp.]
MRKWILLFGICLISVKATYGQGFVVKSNILYDATTTINLGVEFALGDQWTLDVSGNLNPWVFPNTHVVKYENGEADRMEGKFKHWMIQPEIRWWTCEKFNGHFFGAHLHAGSFNVGGLAFLPNSIGVTYPSDQPADRWEYGTGIRWQRFEGWLAGAGVSYGYHWILSNRFSLEFSLGAGYAYLKYDKYSPCPLCSDRQGSNFMHYFGPTKAGISAIFILK